MAKDKVRALDLYDKICKEYAEKLYNERVNENESQDFEK